ncbi:MAG TPA: sugar kinase [Gammaproteobacteria bacterium]|nr:sugar kinase [Gammaproteobacteria bacterium]
MRVVCVGEVLLRLTAPRREVLLQSAALDVWRGGAEANVAVSLACFGHDAAVVSAVPDNPLGEACTGELRRRRVDTTHVLARPGRMGLYFLTPGAGLRPSDVIYDRADSVFARASAGDFDWSRILRGADWLHVSGVTPALGPRSTELARVALSAARRQGVRVSFDCNYRAKLWSAWDSNPAATLAELAGLADLLFADERMLAMLLPDEKQAAEASDPFAALAAAAFARFKNLERIATSTRVEHDVDRHVLGGRCAEARGVADAEPRSIAGIVDRIGSGDAFAAGLLHALGAGRGARDAVAFAVAASCLKHSIPGDANLATAADVEALLSSQGFAVRR